MIADVVLVVLLAGGDGGVVLLDASDDFLEQGLLQFFRVLESPLGVGIFRFEIGNDFGVLALLEPVVVIGARMSMGGGDLVGTALGPGRAGKIRQDRSSGEEEKEENEMAVHGDLATRRK